MVCYKIGSVFIIGIPSTYPVDGRYLLQSGLSPENDVYQNYVQHIVRHYNTEYSIVFDGYGQEPSIKSVEQARGA